MSMSDVLHLALATNVLLPVGEVEQPLIWQRPG
jgi:hypothetical protein